MSAAQGTGDGAPDAQEYAGELGGFVLARSAVDRMSARRGDTEWLAAAWADPGTGVLVLDNARALVRFGDKEAELVLVPPARAPEGLRFLLGVDDAGVAYFGVIGTAGMPGVATRRRGGARCGHPGWRPGSARPRNARPASRPGSARPATGRAAIRRSRKPRTRKPQSRKPQTRKPRTRKPRTRKPQTRKPQTRKPQTRKPQTRKPRTRKPASNPQTRKPQTRNRQGSNPRIRKPPARKPPSSRP